MNSDPGGVSDMAVAVTQAHGGSCKSAQTQLYAASQAGSWRGWVLC